MSWDCKLIITSLKNDVYHGPRLKFGDRNNIEETDHAIDGFPQMNSIVSCPINGQVSEFVYRDELRMKTRHLFSYNGTPIRLKKVISGRPGRIPIRVRNMNILGRPA